MSTKEEREARSKSSKRSRLPVGTLVAVRRSLAVPTVPPLPHSALKSKLSQKTPNKRQQTAERKARVTFNSEAAAPPEADAASANKENVGSRPVRRNLSFRGEKSKARQSAVVRPNVVTRSQASLRDQVSMLEASLEQSEAEVAVLKAQASEASKQQKELKQRLQQADEKLEEQDEAVSIERSHWEKNLLSASIDPVCLRRLQAQERSSEEVERMKRDTAVLSDALQSFISETSDTLQLLQSITCSDPSTEDESGTAAELT